MVDHNTCRVKTDPGPYEPLRIAQAEQVFANLKQVLEAGGSAMERIIKVTTYLTDMRNFPKIIELRENILPSHIPLIRSSKLSLSLCLNS